MVGAKLGDDLIISKIKTSACNFDMNVDAILKLKAAGASDAVIHAMVDGSPTAKAVVKEASLTGGASGLVKVELKTPVRLIVDEPLSSKTSKSGQTFRLISAEDVLVNGKIVVAKGSSAAGRITLVEKGNMNVYGRVEVTIDSVRAVDGQSIPLEGRLAETGIGKWGMGNGERRKDRKGGIHQHCRGKGDGSQNVKAGDPLSVQPHWSPDGKTIVYSDYTGSGPPLIAVDLRTGKATKLTSPGQNGPDTFISWR